MKKYLVFLLFLIIFISLFSHQNTEFHKEIFLIKFASDAVLPVSEYSTEIKEIDIFLNKIGSFRCKRLIKSASRKNHPLNRIFKLETESHLRAKEIIARLEDFQQIELVELEPQSSVLETPNDPRFSEQLSLTHILTEEAWNIHKCEDGYIPIIAIVDTGVLWSHQDLFDNIWQNLGEDLDGDGIVRLPDGTFDPDDINGIDDDGNGYIDDFIGWNFYGDDNYPGAGSHGTKVAGFASAVTNNSIGIASTAWNAQLMPIQSGSGSSISKGYEGIVYAAENGADIINNSWGGSGYSYIFQEIIDYVESLGSIVVAAAGNSNNTIKLYPASYHNVISVANITLDDLKYGSSTYNYAVDVSAPGVNTLSTSSNGSYNNGGSGTSYSSPVVASLLALVKSYHPDWTNEQIRTQVLFSSFNLNNNNPSYVNRLGYGRIDSYSALMDTVVWEDFLKIEFNRITSFSETNNNLAIEPDENVSLDLELSVYSYHSDPVNVTLTLSCEDSQISIINDTFEANANSDELLEIENAFDIHFSEDITSRAIPFTITISSDTEIVSDTEYQFNLIVNAGGILVFEGVENCCDFSGTYIKNYLESLNYNVVLTTDFPASFKDFDAVFLSFGSIDGNTVRINSQSMVDAITNYLLEGGNLYLEGSDAIGFDIGYYLEDTSLWNLLGIASAEDGLTNNIDSLIGQSESIAEGMEFLSTSQSNVTWIDKFTPDDSGIVLFNESNYGNTAIENIGEFSQKTIVSSYSLAKLNDNGDSTKNELLARIMNFFGDQSVLNIPENVNASISESVLTLTWNSVEWASSYKVFSSVKPDSDFTEDFSGNLNGTSWSVNITEEKKFYYVKAYR